MTVDEVKAAAASVTIDKQIACVRRELAMRHRNYTRWVADGRMKQAESDHQLAAMQAVHDTLMKVKEVADAKGRLF